jgi:flavin reductase (DIM6/NTAB) family NADH-FMN oxidoreductase RutF
MLLVNCSRRDGAEKDTARNIQATGDFVINVSTEGQLDLMHSCSAELGPEVSETERFAIALAPSRIVSAPRVADAPVSFECRLHRMIEVGDERNQLIIGEVVHAHVDPAVLNGDKIDQARLRPIGRIGGPTYTALGELFHRPALSGQLADLARLKQAGGNR